ncbi:MAG: MFS transporter [Gudongella sp.]|nr:MFS transporter [Gudongella sp.]
MEKLSKNNIIFYFSFLWHGLFLSLTMAMIDFNTVFPSLVDSLTKYKLIFGFLYSIMLGAPLLFNIVFSHYLKKYEYKKKFLLIGIYLRALSFLGMAIFVFLFGKTNPNIVIISFFFLILLFSISGGFAGLSYSELVGKLFKRKERGKLYSSKQLIGSIAALGGGLIVTRVFSLTNLSYPLNYVILLFVGFIGLVVASAGFYLVKEPPSIIITKENDTLLNYIKEIPSLLKNDLTFSNFIIVENMASFSLMLLPFYMVYARYSFNLNQSYIGRYLLFQITGTIFSNFLWGFLSEKFGSKSVVKVCIIIGGSIPIVALILSRFGPDIYSFVFLLVGFVISGRRIGFDSYLLDIAPEDKRTVYLGVRGTLNIFVVILPILGGIFIDIIGYSITFIIVSILMYISVYLFSNKNSIRSEN